MPQSKSESFFDWAWSSLKGLMGVHEGTLLAEQAHELGLETESWILDSGQAPTQRDWIGSQDHETAELYFEEESLAQLARARLLAEFPGVEALSIEEQKPQDWDAEWKASFRGVDLPPFWKIRPPWVNEPATGPETVIVLTPGAGFGTGTHETTQLCLKAIAEASSALGSLNGVQVLDFGSGSGVLGIAAAKLGAKVEAVEIDPLAVDNARQNAEMNGVGGAIRFFDDLSRARGTYRLVLANILKPVLLQYADSLIDRLAPGHFCLVLSGLTAPDVEEVRERFERGLSARQKTTQVLALGEWRGLVWSHL